MLIIIILLILILLSAMTIKPSVAQAAILSVQVCGEDGYDAYYLRPNAAGLPKVFADHSKYFNMYWITKKSYRDTPVYCIDIDNPKITIGGDYSVSTTARTNLTDEQKLLLSIALAYVYDGKETKYGGNWQEEQLASQIVLWMIGEGYYEFDSYGNAILDGFTPNAKIGGIARRMLEDIHAYRKIPSFTAENEETAEVFEMKWDGEKYSVALTDKNNILSLFDFSCESADISVDGNTLTVSAENMTAEEIYTVKATKIMPDKRAQVMYMTLNKNQEMIHKGVELDEEITAYFKIKVGYGRVIVTKTAEDGGVKANINFTLSGENYSETQATDKNGTAVFDNVPAGKYTVSEEELVGYLKAEDKKITVHNGETAEVSFYNEFIKGYIEIKKSADYPENRPLGGIKFDILNSAGTVIDTLTTDENGYAKSGFLKYGLYRIREFNTPEGFMTAEPLEVYVTEHMKTYSYDIENRVIKRDIKVIKTDSETGKAIPIAGVKFKLTDSEGKELAVYETDENGEIYIESLTYGQYSLTEISPPKGYMLSDEAVKIDVTADSPEITEIRFSDEPIKGRIEIFKTGEMHTKTDISKTEYGDLYTPIFEESYLDGAKFEITAKDDIHTPDGTLRFAKGEVVDSLSTEGGKATSRELYPGTYVVKEIASPEGYLITSETAEVTVSDSTETLNLSSAVTFRNDRQKCALTLRKSVEVFNADDVNAPTFDTEHKKGMVFGLFTDEVISDIPKDSLVGIYETDESGEISAGGYLPYGKYYFKELKAPEGYILDGTHYEVDLLFDAESGEVKEITVNNGKEIVNRLVKKEISIKKTDTNGNTLPDCVIEIYDEGGNVVFRGITDGKGEVKVTLPMGKYTFREIMPPEGYVRNPAEFAFEITSDGEFVGDSSITNEEVKIVILKVNETGEVLEGAEFTIYKDGEIYGIFETDENGEIILERLPFGNYEIVETKVPVGYEKSEEVYSFTVDENYENTEEKIVFENEKIRNPHTGDDGNIFVLFFIVLILTMAVIALVMRKIKESEDK